jgi:urease accessory protein
LADLTIYVIDVAQARRSQEGRARHHALGPSRHQQNRSCPHVGLARGDGRDTRRMRGERPFVFTNLRTGEGAAEVVRFVEREGGLG